MFNKKLENLEELLNFLWEEFRDYCRKRTHTVNYSGNGKIEHFLNFLEEKYTIKK